MRNITVESLERIPVEDQQVERVERKGVSPPDSICGAIMEEISVALRKEYTETFGGILHHNIDKGLLVAGRTTPKLGGGVVDEPMRLVFGDRAIYWLCSQIGWPIDEPLIASAQLTLARGVSLTSIKDDIERIMLRELDEIYGFTACLARGEYPVW